MVKNMIDKEEIKSEIIEVLNRFCTDYNIPSVNISDDELNKFLKVMKKHFLDHGNMKEYIYAINVVIRRAPSFAIGQEEINIGHIKRALNDLHAYSIPVAEIEEMRCELSEVPFQKRKK